MRSSITTVARKILGISTKRANEFIKRAEKEEGIYLRDMTGGIASKITRINFMEWCLKEMAEDGGFDDDDFVFRLIDDYIDRLREEVLSAAAKDDAKAF